METAMTHTNHAYFLMFFEEGLPSSMFLNGVILIIFLDSDAHLDPCCMNQKAWPMNVLMISNNQF